MKFKDEAPGIGPRADLLSQSIAEVLSHSSRRRKAAVAGGALLSAAMIVGPTTPAFAQDAETDEIQEQVIVTGSRIPRRDFTANSPITTVDEVLFDETTNIGVETVLNQLPQFVPAVTQFTTTDVQQTATNTVGASTVSLRGLGPNRNLVLINGRRAMPVNATMVVDTNSIPSSAIARVEVISGGASAVYGADAVGGVVNFVLKDDYEGASVDIRFGDTQHGGNQEITVSGLIGANVAGDRGNVMLGVERSTRSKQWSWERDWRIEDMSNPNTNATAFFWGTDTWITNENGSPAFSNQPAATDADIPAGAPASAVSIEGLYGTDALNSSFFFANTNFTRQNVNPDGTLYTGLMQNGGAGGAYRYNGSFSGNNDGYFPGLPFRVIQPNGAIKENNLWNWSSTPLERLSAFANGHFDLTDNITVTAQAMVTRTQTETQLGLSADTITFWGAAIPFGDEIYTGGPVMAVGNGTNEFTTVPSSLLPNGETNPDYTIGGRFDVECDAQPTAAMPWLDGLPGCTMSEAWPTSPDIYNLFSSRPDPDAILWANSPPDYLRDALGGGRSSSNTLTTMNFSLGLEGELPSGNDFWDVTLSTGRTDNSIIQRGSVRLNSYRALMAFPNFGKNAIFDPNPYADGFAESIPTCTSGLPIVDRRQVTADCATMISPDLKNQNEVTQTILEANLVGDLTDMSAGPLQYALGLAYRENSYEFNPDNLSNTQNLVDPIAGLFPNSVSFGEFDVSEIYGELLIPVVSDGPAGVEHFNVEIGGRISEWSMPQMPTLETYKLLLDWAITPRYRIRGGFNRAFRAPNLGELFITRTQIFGGAGANFGDHCSQNLDTPSPYSATAGGGADAAQIAQTLSICRAMMGGSGAADYYESFGAGTQESIDEQPTGGGLGIPNSFGNINLREEQADTITLGVVMDFHDNFTLTVDYYEIEIEDMIALESADSTYERCLSREFNPGGSSTTLACNQIFRNPSSGAAANIDRSFTNEGRALMSGVDLQLNWSRSLGQGGFSMNSVANFNLESITQDQPGLDEIDHSGYSSCSLQIQCQQYDYRIFSTFSYFQGPWNISLRHQYWPALDNGSCRTNPTSDACTYSSFPSHDLFALTAGYSFDRYTVRLGIENLLDEEPPCIGQRPDNTPFPLDCTRTAGSGGATYDPLGRRYFVSMTMDF